MRPSTLSVLCTAALMLPASAAPLDETYKLMIPASKTPTTVEFIGPSELTNPAVLDESAKSTTHTIPVGDTSKPYRLPKSKLNRLPRSASFRQADYGVSPNVTFAQVPVPVQGVEAKPSVVPLSGRADDKWGDARTKPAYTYFSETETPSSGDLPKAAAASGVASKAVSDTDSSVPGAAPAPPLPTEQLPNSNGDQGSARPGLSAASKSVGNLLETSGQDRYEASYHAHDILGAMSAHADPILAQSNALGKGPLSDKVGGKLTHSILRRVLAPVSYLTGPQRDSRFNVAKALGGHNFQIDTNTLLPERVDPAKNMSDPYTAREQLRKEQTGLLNVDSNRPAPSPLPPSPSGLPELNASNATTSALDKDAKAVPTPSSVPLDDVDKVEAAPKAP
ncbi:hypothetical protein C8Q79DRAFT_712971 [Trametes meyenii]|nr:hypothetical protein C8Q79DRAFT_712971 [Trametes meyenii]